MVRPDTDAMSGVERAELAAHALFDRPDEPTIHEPAGAAECRAAVRVLADRFASGGGTLTAIVSNARSAAQLLSSDRLQGLSEIVQNADDAGASHVMFRQTSTSLVASHDGRPLTLRDVHALAAPWLTTKTQDAAATGRFGIGLLTLHSLAPSFELHNRNYHLKLGDPTVSAVEPALVDGPHSSADGTTILSIPLAEDALEPGELMAWCRDWDDSSLLFLKSVRKVTFTTDASTRVLRLSARAAGSWTARIGGEPAEVLHQVMQAPDGRAWSRYSADAVSPPGLHRANKRAEPTTPLSVALCHDVSADTGMVHAGLPVAPTHLKLRVNAQLDPIASRQGFTSGAWNKALVQRVAELWAAAILDRFREAPAASWALVPLREEEPEDAHGSRRGLLDVLADDIAAAALSTVAPQLRLSVGHETLPVAELAVEDAELEGLLSDRELADLAHLDAALPQECRDAAGLWRIVLDNWRAAGIPLPQPVTVADAIGLVEAENRDAEATIGLTAAGLAAGLYARLGELRCLVSTDGRSRVTPPRPDELRVLAIGEPGLADTLGIADQLDDAYTADNPPCLQVRQWLVRHHALITSSDDPAVLELVAAAGAKGVSFPSPLTDRQLTAVRDVMEALSQADRERLGRGLGRALRFEAVKYVRGKPASTTTRPFEAYLPKAIDREPDSFAVAADTTPDIVWIAPRYATALRSPLGRPGLGAQRFLRLLGAETAPRVSPHPRLNARYADRRLGLSIQIGDSPPARQQALRDLQATWTLDDWHSPHLQAVLKDIATDRKATRRRARAMALLAVLARAWPQLSDVAEVTAAHDYDGWKLRGTTRAWWLWAAADVPWLDSATAIPTSPQALRVRTAATLAVHGDKPETFLHAAFRTARPDLLTALGVAGEPDTRELVSRLQQLRDADQQDDAITSDVYIAYQALSERASQPRRTSDLSTPKLRELFAHGQGLVLSKHGWRPPIDALRGNPLFGDYKAFVPQLTGCEALWTTLQIRLPSVDDCLDVMRDLARDNRRDAAAETIMLESLRYMTGLVSQNAPDERLQRRLRNMPLLTSAGWNTKTIVYAVDDPPLASGIGQRLPIWTPGGEQSQFAALIGYLRIRELITEHVRLLQPELAVRDDDATVLLQEAVRLLREDLTRNDPAAAESTRVPWTDLETYEVRILRPLQVSVHAHGEVLVVDVVSRIGIHERVLYVVDDSTVGTVDGGGRAVAGLFAADHRRLAQAWLAAIDGARQGREAVRLRLAADVAAQESSMTAASIEARLQAVQQQVRDRQSRADQAPKGAAPSKPRRKDGDPAPASITTPADRPARRLVDPSTLEVVDPRGVIVPRKPTKPPAPPKPSSSAPPVPRPGGAEPRDSAGHRAYTDLEKERLGLDLARQVLGSDAQEMIDLRAQRGLGADAMDELKQFYELKVSAGQEPDEIKLEDSQIRLAMSSEKFFLVVVSGLEGETATPRVRIIANPLSQLHMSERSEVRFSGVRESHSLVYDLRPQSADPPDQPEDTA